MNRYPYITPKPEHSLKEVYENYSVTKETEFVKEFFKEDEVLNIIDECGIELEGNIDKIEFDPIIKLGLSPMRPDCLVHTSDAVYYFEVMSRSNYGKWDQTHHEQFYLKSQRLTQIYDNVKSFAISFKEFDSCYIQELCLMENCYGVHLVFNEEGYKVKVTCMDEKKRITGKNDETNLEFWTKFLTVVKKQTNLFDNISAKKSNCIGKRFNGFGYFNCVATQSFVRVELYLDLGDKEINKDNYSKLLKHKESIENDLGYSLKWELLEEKRASRISVSSDADISDKSTWDEMMKTLSINLKDFSTVISKYAAL